MNQGSNSARRRPGGRTADVTARVYGAVLDLLLEGGAQACTFSAVAARAGVDRSTLHRRFHDKWEMIVDAFMAKAQSNVNPDDTGGFAGDLRSVLEKLGVLMESPLGSAMLVAAIEIRARSIQRAYFDRRMTQLDPMFDRAIERGELRAEVDRELLFSAAAGPLYFRAFIAARPLDHAFVEGIVSNVCWLYCTPSAAAKVSLPARIA